LATGTTSPIGTARLDLEKAVLAAGGTVVHMSAVYGPRVEAGWLARAIRQALAGKTVWYPGDLDAVVDYLYIEDAARALIAGLGRDVARGTRYLAAGPEVTTPRRFLSAVFRAAGREPRLRAVPPPCLWLARLLGGEPLSPDHPSARWERSAPLEGSQIREALGWMPEVYEAEGIVRTVRWMRRRSSEAHLTGRPGAPPESPTHPGEDNGDTPDAGSDRPDDSWKRFAPPAE
jgi:nucleoside-diphosphate-sugar epimerase